MIDLKNCNLVDNVIDAQTLAQDSNMSTGNCGRVVLEPSPPLVLLLRPFSRFVTVNR